MPSFECADCTGTGYIDTDDGESVICPRCDGTGVVFVVDAEGDPEARDPLW